MLRRYLTCLTIAPFGAMLSLQLFLLSACGGGNAQPSCQNGILDGAESDTDCGGFCAPCAAGKSCNSAGDCASGNCSDGQCQPSASCDDRIWNGTETDVDCGGSCPPCATGDKCAEHADCLSETCINGICRDPTCDDGLANGTESDIDCGGECAPCPAGGKCRKSGDCESRNCSGGVCLQASCTDGINNGDESDIDCGGSCPGCAEGQACRVWSDCLSGNCEQQLCAPEALCDDGQRNGSETDVDCGGGCPPCPNGSLCLQDGDCASGLCTNGVCSLPASCGNHVWDGDETDVDCGGSCPPCATGDKCGEHDDCLSETCINGLCRDPACDDGMANGSETDIDCGGPCPPCSAGQHCLVHTDCQESVCANETCQPPSCDDGVRNGDETGIDCGGSCPACPPECGNGIVEPPGEECEPGVAMGATCADYGFTGEGISCTEDCHIDISGCGCVWQKEVVVSPITRRGGTNNTQSGLTGIAVDAQGRIHIVFIDETNDEVRYAMKDSSGWTFGVVTTGAANITAVAIATDSQDRPHVAFLDTDQNKAFHAVEQASKVSGWVMEEVGTTQYDCMDIAIQVDNADVVHIAYDHARPGIDPAYVSYANNSSGSWDVLTWGPYDVSGYPNAIDLAVDAFGSVHIAYGHSNHYSDLWNVEPHYITNSSGLWKTFYLFRFDDRHVGYYASVDTNNQGAAWVSYYDKDLGRLLVSNNTSGAFPSAEEVDNVGDVGAYTALCVTSDDLPHIVYMDVDNDQLKHALWDGNSWSTEIVDSDGATGRDTDMVAVGRRLFVSYTSVAPEMELRHAWTVCPQ